MSRSHATALVLSGSGRHADPWHPFAETSAAIAGVLRGVEGLHVRVTGDLDHALAEHLDGVDLLVVDAGDPHGEPAGGAGPGAGAGAGGAGAGSGDTASDGGTPDPAPTPAGPDPAVLAAAAASIDRWRASGGALLVVHAGTSALVEHPGLLELLPARWVPGRSWHPPFATVVVEPDAASGHPVVAGLDPVVVEDELYTDLDVAPDAVVLAAHRLDGRAHPLVLARDAGGTRVVVDALGHDARSWASPTHAALLRQAARWLLGRS